MYIGQDRVWENKHLETDDEGVEDVFFADQLEAGGRRAEEALRLNGLPHVVLSVVGAQVVVHQ